MSRGFILLAMLVVPARASAQTTVPDPTYGAGGTRVTLARTLGDGTAIETQEIRSRNGTVRERLTSTTSPARDVMIEHEWFDAAGILLSKSTSKFDRGGRQFYSREETFRDGAVASGNLYEEVDGRPRFQRYNPATRAYEPIPDASAELMLLTSRSDLALADSIYLSGTAISEDWSARQFTFGATVSYSYAVGLTWGITTDFQWIRGTRHDVSDGTLQVLAGVSFWQHVRGDFFFAPRVLAGIARTRSLSGMPGGGPPGRAETALAIAAGLDFGTPIFGPLDLTGRIEYNPTFLRRTQHHVRAAAGLRIRF